MSRLLDTDSTIGLELRVSLAEAQDVFNNLAGFDDECTPEAAAAAAARLIGLYPAREVSNPQVFAAGLTALLAAFPLYAVKRVVDPVNGLPSRSKWLPTLAEVKEALTAEKVRRGRIGKNAEHIIMAWRERQQAREFAAAQASPERKAEQIEQAREVQRMIAGTAAAMELRGGKP